eukprot:RCo003633
MVHHPQHCLEMTFRAVPLPSAATLWSRPRILSRGPPPAQRANPADRGPEKEMAASSPLSLSAHVCIWVAHCTTAESLETLPAYLPVNMGTRDCCSSAHGDASLAFPVSQRA